MTPEEIFKKLEDEFGSEVVFNFDDGSGAAKDAFCEIAPYSVAKVGHRMKTDPEMVFDYLECLTGIDFPKQSHLQVAYHLFSYTKKHRLVLKANLDRDDPVLPTVSGVWSAANWQERECYDLLGVHFDGHPDLRRVLLPEDWEGHPLRKDWKPASHYHGIPTTRPDPLAMLTEAAKEKAAKAKPAPAKDATAAAAKAKPAAKAEAKKPEAKKDDAKADAKPEAKKDDAKAEEKTEPKKDDAKAEEKTES